MNICIECECGNKAVLKASEKKYIQLRDCLENQQFYYDGEEIKAGKLKELRIRCDKCRNWITLGFD